MSLAQQAKKLFLWATLIRKAPESVTTPLDRFLKHDIFDFHLIRAILQLSQSAPKQFKSTFCPRISASPLLPFCPDMAHFAQSGSYGALRLVQSGRHYVVAVFKMGLEIYDGRSNECVYSWDGEMGDVVDLAVHCEKPYFALLYGGCGDHPRYVVIRNVADGEVLTSWLIDKIHQFNYAGSATRLALDENDLVYVLIGSNLNCFSLHGTRIYNYEMCDLHPVAQMTVYKRRLLISTSYYYWMYEVLPMTPLIPISLPYDSRAVYPIYRPFAVDPLHDWIWIATNEGFRAIDLQGQMLHSVVWASLSRFDMINCLLPQEGQLRLIISNCATKEIFQWQCDY